MIIQAYNELMTLFFGSADSLPAILQPVSEELCAIFALFMSALVLSIPVFIFVKLIKMVYDGGNLMK